MCKLPFPFSDYRDVCSHFLYFTGWFEETQGP